MIQVERKGERTECVVRGKGFDLLMEFSAVCSSLIDSGVPDEMLVLAIVVGKDMARQEDEKRAENFMEELMRRVKEKRDARND